MKKEYELAVKIQAQIADIFNPECENYISGEELEKYAKEFFHALANIVPCNIFNKLTQDDKNLLEFNHAVNHLVFDLSKTDNP